MSSVVLHSSALLAVLFREPGAEKVRAHLQDSSISAVNASEVTVKLVERSVPLERAIEIVSRQPLNILAFDDELAYLVASLRLATRNIGLSFGDRACLALGLKTGLSVLTADRAWASVDFGVRVEVIR